MINLPYFSSYFLTSQISINPYTIRYCRCRESYDISHKQTYTSKAEGKYRLLDEKLADEEYVIGFKKGNEELRDKVETALKELKEEGKLAEIATKWFGADITTIA